MTIRAIQPLLTDSERKNAISKAILSGEIEIIKLYLQKNFKVHSNINKKSIKKTVTKLAAWLRQEAVEIFF